MLFTTLVIGLAQEAPTAIPTAAVAPLIISGRQSARPAGPYSPGVADIIKLLDAKVDAPVVLAVIQNSPVAYNPDATELIALKEHGASTEVLMTLLHHGDELWLQMAQAQGQSAVNPLAAAAAYDYAQPNGYAPAGAYPPYPYDYSDASYAPYPAIDYSYGYGWPLAYWPSAGIGGYWPYGYAHGRYYLRNGYGRHWGDGGHRAWASAAPVAARAPHFVSAPIGGHTSSPAVQPSGMRGSGGFGGRSGGRSH